MRPDFCRVARTKLTKRFRAPPLRTSIESKPRRPMRWSRCASRMRHPMSRADDRNSVVKFRHRGNRQNMADSRRFYYFIAAQVCLTVFSTAISFATFTLAPLTISVAQIPLNAWLFSHRFEKGKFWQFVWRIQGANLLACALLIALIRIFGRRYFRVFLDFDAWSF